ncbi:LADA_0A01816g1_1 [Lachancea dasiensis]|uniref:LADA_0A01816g1_1 n=1 Tax=Lachancea dasiensis TaxID=1072105 RepID=A0A1G4IM54_9SACH|nr:LADA_0A01816g1_1 [Lachancea dasiensis]
MTEMQSSLLVIHPAMTVTPEKVASVKKSALFSNSGVVDQFLINKLNDSSVVLEDGKYDLVYYLTPEIPSQIQFPTTLIPVLAKSLQAGGRLYGLSDSLKIDALINGLEIVDARDDYHWVKKAGFQDVVAAPVALKTKASSGASSIQGTQKMLPTFKKASSSVTKALPTFKRADSPSVNQLAEDLDNLDDAEEGDDSDELTAAKSKFFDDVEGLDSAESIDEEDLIDEAEQNLITVVTCGKTKNRRRKACKDCTCGMKEQEEQMLDAARTVQDQVLGKKVEFDEQELSEIDFTIQGKKVGGCGSCSLGDAFRCSGCPYLGLPAFKPGQPISLTSIDDDL